MSTNSTAFPPSGPVGPDTLITVKILIGGQNRRFKLALRDLGSHVLPQKLRFLLQIPPTSDVKFERFSDSAGTYVILDSTSPTVYKQLYRAAKAKLKLRLRATVVNGGQKTESVEHKAENPEADSKPAEFRGNKYFDTVLAKPAVDVRQLLDLTTLRVGNSPSSPMKMSETEVQPSFSKPYQPYPDFCGNAFSIDCNHCGQSVTNEHYHCSKCEHGDFDLCPTCIERGVTCDGDDHWLIKRCIKDGKVLSSNTETLAPKNKTQIPPVAVAAANSTKTTELSIEEDQRTCNSCIIQLGQSSFVTCQQCADYDLCFFCLEHGQHGHHPGHDFAPVDASSAAVTPYLKDLCQKGRALKHEAVCDGCDAQIVGVRHKCLGCPDFDYCSTCILSAGSIHPDHRFAPIYEQLGAITLKKEQHRGVYCDGPVCTARAKKSYIRGDRYKCAICHDLDFCANCEALPSNPHNPTHPLIKIKFPIRQVSVSTINDDLHDGHSTTLGDRPAARHVATETTRSSSTNAATQVQTVAETKPVEHKPAVAEKAADVALFASFESEEVADGSRFPPNRLLNQSWTLRNPGPSTWPAGCAVHFVGGEGMMRNLDDKHPSPVSSMTLANQTNVCATPVAPGESHTFTVVMRSPARLGRAISYWRLKTAEGLPFGHKLWCQIYVTDDAVAEVPAAVPVEAAAEEEDQFAEAEESQDSSQMIFPKLEKESPESSINDVKQSSVAEPSVTSEDQDQDLLDDLESMALDDDSTEDGFMTDEEYDILDAQDEADLLEAQHARQ